MKKQRLLLSVRLTGINGERKIMSSESWIESFNNYMAGYIKEEIIRPFLQKEGFDENIIDEVEVTLKPKKRLTMKEIEKLSKK